MKKALIWHMIYFRKIQTKYFKLNLLTTFHRQNSFFRKACQRKMSPCQTTDAAIYILECTEFFSIYLIFQPKLSLWFGGQTILSKMSKNWQKQLFNTMRTCQKFGRRRGRKLIDLNKSRAICRIFCSYRQHLEANREL